MENHRLDLSKEDSKDLENLKYSLTESLENDSGNVLSLVEFFNKRSSVSAPNTPVETKCFNFPSHSHSNPDLRNILPIDLKMSHVNEIEPLKASRAGLKAWITRYVNSIKEMQSSGSLTLCKLQKQESLINERINRIFEIEEKISEIYIKYKVSESDEARLKDADETHSFILNSQNAVANCEELLIDKKQVKVSSNDLTRNELLEALGKMNNPSSTVLDCQEFHGSENDKWNFGQWLPQFFSVVKNNPGWDESAKLTYLKSKIKGSAKNVIRSVQQGSEGFKQAITALKHHYLNVKAHKDHLFSKLYNLKPATGPEYSKTEQYIAEVRAILLDLKDNYKCNLLIESSGGYEFVSHLVFSKLPFEVQNALITKVGSQYPTFMQIYDEHMEILYNLNRLKKKKAEMHKDSNSHKIKKFTSSEATPADNFASQATKVVKSDRDQVYHCRFCTADGHANAYCKIYPTHDSRKARCIELGLCSLCTLPNHTADKCYGKNNKLRYPCKRCHSAGHVAAMCDNAKGNFKQEQTNVCLSTNMQSLSNYLLPILKIKMKGHNGKFINFNCLFDTASSRSYISNYISDQMGLHKELVKDVEYNVKTFLGSGAKTLQEAMVTVYLPSGRYLLRPMLIDSQFNVDLKVRGFNEAIQNIKNKNYNLAAEFNEPILGLIGADVIQFIKELKVVQCMNGSAFSVTTGIVPFGDTNHFLYPGQVPIEAPTNIIKKTEINFKTIINELPILSEESINFCLNPKQSYEDPAASFFEESSVERTIDNSTVVKNLESMFNCESIGIIDSPDSISNYDQDMIKKFEEGIEIKNNQINVELVWHDNVDQVPSNHNVALKICDIVSDKLQRKGKLEPYNQIFFEQLKEGVIEEFECAPEDFEKYNWLPHHPVYKDDPTSTFPARPVFNCSLKSEKTKPSLNEAAYVGINLMQDMAALVMLFRTNKYTLLGDLKKAFLQIKLKLERDRNRFCFFLRVGNKLKCFRYRTIIFGFCSSPFILNYVLKYIARQGQQDDCADMIRNKFFVDNLATSSNDIQSLTKLYVDCSERMKQVHFDLRSCNTNDENLKDLMKKDGKFITHDCEYDKVLGYKYSSTKDTMKLAPIKIDAGANTHRAFLSNYAGIFDLLYFTAPVTVRGKTLLSSLWNLRKTGGTWDKTLSGEFQKTWAKLAPDLEGLSDLEFPRYCMSQDKPTDFFIFTDASQLAYGYVLYAKQESNSNFVTAKCKTAPLQKKTLPILELLGVYLGLMSIVKYLKIYKHFSIKTVTVACDSQVVLQWILSDPNKCKKKVFVANRLKDIKRFETEILNEHNININYRYVPTDCNPADLLTRGLSLESFKQQLEFWLHGPEFLNMDKVKWPTSNLCCLSSDSQTIVMATQAIPVPIAPAIISLDNYSKLSIAVNVASNVIEFCSKTGGLSGERRQERWGSKDYKECGKLYLIQSVQHQCFEEEIEFLKDPRDKPVPDLVRNYNLFLDQYGTVRSDCRIGKNLHFDFEILNPILLPKQHKLTNLIIVDSHVRVKHLGIQSTLNKVRIAGFRLMKPYLSVRTAISPCLICKRFNNLSFKYPHMTNLPAHRVNMVRPYLHVGVDYTGHLMIKDQVTINKKVIKFERKVYILIFTCLNVRACHIELIPEMSTDHFVLAMVRFCNEYGIPSHLYSDNARSFISGVNIMEKVFTSNEFQEKFGIYDIKHVRIPVYSPWVGATWERLIRVVKDCLKKTISRQKLNYFQLKTVLSDIQLAINSRPLTYRCADEDGLEILTPNKFLRPHVDNNLIVRNPREDLVEPVSRKDLVKSLSVREKMVSHFKSLWYESYLLSLRSLYKNLHETDFVNKIRVNDLVLIKNPVKARQHWRLGRVIELVYGSDNKVRTVKLLRGDAKYRQQSVRKLELHSIKNLYPLELSITHNHVADSEVDQNLLNLEVEDLSEIDEPNTNSDQSAETDDINANYEDLSEINDFSYNPENLDDSESRGPTLKFTYDLEPEELQSFQGQDAIAENLEEILEDNTPEMGHTEPSVNVVDSEQISNEGPEEPPNVSSRGRVRRPLRRPLDNDFVWE